MCIATYPCSAFRDGLNRINTLIGMRANIRLQKWMSDIILHQSDQESWEKWLRLGLSLRKQRMIMGHLFLEGKGSQINKSRKYRAFCPFLSPSEGSSLNCLVHIRQSQCGTLLLTLHCPPVTAKLHVAFFKKLPLFSFWFNHFSRMHAYTHTWVQITVVMSLSTHFYKSLLFLKWPLAV